MNKTIVLCGAHGTGKSKICDNIIKYGIIENGIKEEKISNFCRIPTTHRRPYQNFSNITKDVEHYLNFAFIPEQFREVVKDVPNFTKQTEEITLATYAKQLYLESLYREQGKNVLCDRSVLDTFVYCDYFNGGYSMASKNDFGVNSYSASKYTEKTYSKIYLIEPSDREIEPDGFRMTDKKQQLEIHKLFLEYFKDFSNVEIINQEKQEKIVEMVVNDFSLC